MRYAVVRQTGGSRLTYPGGGGLLGPDTVLLHSPPPPRPCSLRHCLFWVPPPLSSKRPCLISGGGGGGGKRGPRAHGNTARQAMDGLWTEARGQQTQSNDPRNNQHILNRPIIGRR